MYRSIETVAEEMGGTVVAEFSLAYTSYEFYDFGVIKTDTGYYISTDNGCSCPTPFESHTPDDFTGPLTKEQVAEEYESLAKAQSYDALPPADIAENVKDILAW